MGGNIAGASHIGLGIGGQSGWRCRHDLVPGASSSVDFVTSEMRPLVPQAALERTWPLCRIRAKALVWADWCQGLSFNHPISLFDPLAIISSSRPSGFIGRCAQQRSRVAEGHRAATCP